MPSWSELLVDFAQQPDAGKAQWLDAKFAETFAWVSALRNGRRVLFYASGFLQKPSVPGETIMITHEDLNGLMSGVYGMDCSKGLSLILHTPGGVTNAAESFVAYLRSKFDDVEVIVPTFAMSAGTMIALAADMIIMGRQSQLGPIDPQLNLGGGRSVSARAVVEQFDRAKSEILADVATAHVWAPIVQSLGPALVQEAGNALDYSEQMVARWLAEYMLKADTDRVAKGQTIAHHFNDATAHKSHGRRIDRDEARAQGVFVEDLETVPELQDAVLTAYHLMTIMIENTLTTKIVRSDTGAQWIKQWSAPAPAGP